MHFILAALALATAPNHQLAMSAHHLCSGVFVVGRDLARSPEVVIEHDIKRFDFFQWGDDFEYAVDMEKKTARVWVASGPSWTAQYNGDQGCTILPQGASDVFFEPMKLPSKLPDAEKQDGQLEMQAPMRSCPKSTMRSIGRWHRRSSTLER